MQQDLTQYLPPMLAVLGAMLQWLRQFPKVHDWYVGLIAFGLANGAYFLTLDYAHLPGLQLAVIMWVLAIPAHTATVLGGTFVAARAAAGGMAAIPRTNSK